MQKPNLSTQGLQEIRNPLLPVNYRVMEALGRVERPTNGLGNWGFHPHLNGLSSLRNGLSGLKWIQFAESAVNWQREWQLGFDEIYKVGKSSSLDWE